MVKQYYLENLSEKSFTSAGPRSGETLPALGYTQPNFPFSKLVNCAVLVEKFGFFYGCIFLLHVIYLVDS